MPSRPKPGGSTVNVEGKPIKNGGGTFPTYEDVEKLAREKLESSGITLEQAKRAGISWHGVAETKAFTPHAWDLPSLRIPYFQPTTTEKWETVMVPLSPHPGYGQFYRIRCLRDPRPLPHDFARYLQASSGVCGYFPPTTDWGAVIHNPAVDINITEGELKALKASIEGFPTVGLGGVNSYISNKSGRKSLLPELLAIKLAARRINIVYDNDFAAKPKTIKAVNAAANDLADLLVAHGADVYRVYLPEIEGKKKTGLDDYLMEYGAEAFQALLDTAEPFFAPPLTENALALAFVERNQDKLRFCQSTGKWHRWSGYAWRPDEARLVFGEIGDLCRETARRPGVPQKLKPTLEKASTSAGVERFAQSHAWMAVTARIWNTDPMLLGTPGGTVDLRTGKLSPSNPEDYITKLAAVTPLAKAECPLWRKFLDEITQRNDQLIRFFRQWYGSSLTGDTRDQAFVFIYGPGGNGKSVMNNIIRWILADYAVTATMALFTASPQERHTTDLAMLDGSADGDSRRNPTRPEMG